MSRSAVVALVTGVALLAGFGVVANMYKHGLDGRTWWVIAITIGLGVYGALVTATSVRRLVDPKLETPWPVLIIAFVFIMMAAIGRSQRRKEEGDPNYLVSNDDDKNDPDPSNGPMGVGWASLATLLGLVMYGGGIALLWTFTSHPQLAHAKTTTAEKAPTPTPVPAPKAGPAPTTNGAPREPDILDAANLGAAIDFARPHFTDNRKAPNRGAELLARYAATELAWKDVVIAKNETAPALVEKDPTKEWGKRLCVAGTLAQIEKSSLAGVDGFVAVLDTKTKDELQLFVVGDTGNLVKRKPARFCGVVTGRIDVDGRPATFAVGMLAKP